METMYPAQWYTNCSLTFSWYRAKEDACRTALTNLCLNTDLIEQANSLGELVTKQVNEIKGG